MQNVCPPLTSDSLGTRDLGTLSGGAGGGVEWRVLLCLELSAGVQVAFIIFKAGTNAKEKKFLGLPEQIQPAGLAAAGPSHSFSEGTRPAPQPPQAHSVDCCQQVRTKRAMPKAGESSPGPAALPFPGAQRE